MDDYDSDKSDSTDDIFSSPQSREAKEISNFLTQFKKQTSKQRLHVTESGNLVIRKVTREEEPNIV